MPEPRSIAGNGKMAITLPGLFVEKGEEKQGCFGGQIIISVCSFGKQMLNFTVNGRRMRVASQYQQYGAGDVSMLIQSKPLTQKPNVQQKAKQPRAHDRRFTQEKKNAQNLIVKAEAKKDSMKKVENKVPARGKAVKIEPKVEPVLAKQEEPIAPVPQPKKEDSITQVIVRYNHYKHPFPASNSLLSFLPIEEKYSFGDVFKGNFLPILKNYKNNELIQPETIGKAIEYSWRVQENVEYRLEIQQDEEQESKHEKKIYKAEQSGVKHCVCNKKTSAFHQLNEELKKLDPSEYGGARHRQLLEQRDLQDILYS